MPTSLNLLKLEHASGETGKAGELVSELLLPLTIGAAADGSSMVPSKTVVVPSVLCTRIGGAGAETRLRGPSGSIILLPFREVIAFLLSAMAAVLLQGFINDCMNKSASPAVPSTCRLSRELDCFIPLPNGDG